MRDMSTRRGRDRWSRSLALAALLAVGTACGGGGDTRSADAHRATIGRAADARTAASPQRAVVPSPLGTAPGRATTAPGATGQGAQTAPAPPPPDLGTRRPEAPPNTISLDALHQQGRTHVLR